MQKIHPNYDRNFMDKGIKMILEQLQKTLVGSNNVAKIKQPQQLYSQIKIPIEDEPMPKEELINTFRIVLQNSVKPYHPHFHNQLFGGFDQFSALGAVMSPLINGSMYTYEIAPVLTLMEKQVFSYFRQRLDWETSDGLMTPGGSFGNIMAIQCARHNAFPEVKEKGMKALPSLKIMVSDNSHYSMKKGAFLCGLGSQSLSLVETNQIGQMKIDSLQKKIKEELQEGNVPFMVASLIGSTVQGSIDDIEQISKIAKKYKLWHHVDAAYGGVIFFSKKLRSKVGDCKGVDSIVFDPHKGMLVSLQATIFLCQKQNLMYQSNSVVADYLFHKQRAYYDNSLDTGNKSLLCGRVIDILKVWGYFKGNGMKGVQHQINNQYELAQNLAKYIKQNSDKFQLYIPQVLFNNVCFWCLPKKLIEDKQKLSKQEYETRLSKITVMAKKYMVQEGKMLAGYSSTKGSPYFWREVMSNPYNTNEQIQQEIEWIYSYCERAYKQLYE